MENLGHKRLTASGKLALAGGDSQDQHTKIGGIQLVAGSDAATVIGYKVGAATAGEEFMKLACGANETAEWFPGFLIGSPRGWYFAVTGTGPAVHVLHT